MIHAERYLNFSRDKYSSKSHLEFLKKEACICTNRFGVDVHHVQRVARGRNDYLAVPVTHEIHLGEIHQKGDSFVENKYCIDFKDAVIAMLIKRIIQLGG